MSSTPRKYLIPCLVLIVLMGAGCRGSDRRAEEPTPDFPFGMEEPVTTGGDSDSDEGMSACANEYYPLRAGYTIDYRTQGGGTGEGNTSRLSVLEATSTDVKVKNTISRPSVAPLEYELEYTCENGSLVAKGYVAALSMTAAEGPVERGADVKTLSSEGQFMPTRISVGQEWEAKYSIEIRPLGRPDVLQKRMAKMTMDVLIIRRAMEKESITVPAGRFEAMKIASNTFFNGALAHTGYEWWVKGKGMVKSVQGNGSGAITTEATSIRTSSR